ncbi:hypothetical protein J6590_032256 [Homalodisca vitripennis]|nr:hypothetical protein J6590_032256 [Homalodisca vitripennis]
MHTESPSGMSIFDPRKDPPLASSGLVVEQVHLCHEPPTRYIIISNYQARQTININALHKRAWNKEWIIFIQRPRLASSSRPTADDLILNGRNVVSQRRTEWHSLCSDIQPPRRAVMGCESTLNCRHHDGSDTSSPHRKKDSVTQHFCPTTRTYQHGEVNVPLKMQTSRPPVCSVLATGAADRQWPDATAPRRTRRRRSASRHYLPTH